MQQRILLIRLSAIGDVVMASGVIPALRQAWPQAHIAWLAEASTAPLLRGNPHLDEVIVWPRSHWKELWRSKRILTLLREIGRFVADLRRRRFSLVLDMQGLLKSGVWAWLSGAPERIGLGSKEGSQHLMTRTLSREGDNQLIGSEYRKLVADLGCDPRAFRLELIPDRKDREEAVEELTKRCASGPYAVLAAFTTRPQKHWFEPSWAELSCRIQRELGLTPILLGSKQDRAAASRILELGGCGHDFAGVLSLGASAALVMGASLVIGVDTGLTHMGSAFRVPTVALFGATRPYLDPDAPATRIIYKALACAPCRYNPTCGGAFTCMREISVGEVMDTAASVME